MDLRAVPPTTPPLAKLDELIGFPLINACPPRGDCLAWSPLVFSTHVASDVLIFLACISIPLAMGRFERRPADPSSRGCVWLFAAFIMACGASQLMELVMLWQPIHGLDALLKALTALLAVATSLALWRRVPKAMNRLKPGQPEHANASAPGWSVAPTHADEPSRTAGKAERDILRREQMIMAAIIERSSEIIVVKDLEGRYLLVNPEAERAFGIPANQILGREVSALLPPHEAETVRAHDARVMTENKMHVFEETNNTPSGVRTFLSTRGPLRDDKQRIIGVFTISRDITERHRDAESLKQRNDELERFNRAAVGRELDMIELKQQVNALSRELGRSPPFAMEALSEARS